MTLCFIYQLAALALKQRTASIIIPVPDEPAHSQKALENFVFFVTGVVWRNSQNLHYFGYVAACDRFEFFFQMSMEVLIRNNADKARELLLEYVHPLATLVKLYCLQKLQ